MAVFFYDTKETFGNISEGYQKACLTYNGSYSAQPSKQRITDAQLVLITKHLLPLFVERTAKDKYSFRVLTYSEVSGCQSVSSMAVFTNEGGGISLLTVVLTVAFGTSHFTDAGSKDHLDATSVISHCQRRQRKKEK